MTIGGIISAIIIGAVIGLLGRLVLPGRQSIGIIWTIVVGIIAALIGTAIVGGLRDTNGIDWIEIVVQVVLAAIGVAIVARVQGRPRT